MTKAAGGYVRIEIRQREPVGRGLRKRFNAASKAAWHATATHFHATMRDDRFTESHARAAGYTARKGQNAPPGSKAYRHSYYGIKLRSPKMGGGVGRAAPLVKSGTTRKAVRTASITSTSKGGRATYRGARVFNFRHPRSRVRMNEEFRRLLQREAEELARVYDRELDAGLDEETTD